MENKSMFGGDVSPRSDLELTDVAVQFLREAAKWAKFLSILGFIACGFLVLFSFFAGSLISASAVYGSPLTGISSAVITFFYLLIALLAFIPMYFLYKFSSNVADAIDLRNSNSLEFGLGSLKSYFKFNGIMAIIVMSIYALMFVILIFAGMIGLLA